MFQLYNIYLKVFISSRWSRSIWGSGEKIRRRNSGHEIVWSEKSGITKFHFDWICCDANCRKMYSLTKRKDQLIRLYFSHLKTSLVQTWNNDTSTDVYMKWINLLQMHSVVVHLIPSHIELSRNVCFLEVKYF